MKEINKKKKVTIILVVVLSILVLSNLVFRLISNKNLKQDEEEIINEVVDAEDYDKLIEVKSKDEYINGQKSNLDRWEKINEEHKKTITQDLWTNDKAQKEFLETSKKLVNISKKVKNYTWLDGGNSTELLFTQAMDYKIDELKLREEIFTLVKNKDVKVNDVMKQAEEFSKKSNDLLLQAKNKLEKLDKQ